MKNSNMKQVVFYKILYTVLILAAYLIGRRLPLFMVDTSVYIGKALNTGDLLLQTVSGDLYRCSLFALGIAPVMIASILTQVLTAFRSKEKTSKISPVKRNRFSMRLTLCIAVVQAIVTASELKFKAEGNMAVVSAFVAAVELVAGTMMILWLANRNKKYGIGGQSALIALNLIDTIRLILVDRPLSELLLPLGISLLVMNVIIVFEYREKRIPLQRISIHNIYSDKNYLAVKWNPIGVMPAMFSMAFFMIPQLFVTMLGWIFPDNACVLWWQENLDLSKPAGVVVYIGVLYGLTLGFSRVFINPDDITEQFLKSGDSIRNIPAGKPTKRYLSGVITGFGMLSATVMSICLGAPMILQLNGILDSELVALPSSVMLLTGVLCNVCNELCAVRDLESYRPFI